MQFGNCLLSLLVDRGGRVPQRLRQLLSMLDVLPEGDIVDALIRRDQVRIAPTPSNCAKASIPPRLLVLS